MIEYGSPPSDDQIEITLFGPGYGEAIAVHLGENIWLLVDSCIDPTAKAPASETYLDSIGVDPNQVKIIVSSHWHDDHVKGLSKLVSKYSSAKFFISAVFSDRDAKAFLAAFNEETSDGLGKGAKELYESIINCEGYDYALYRTMLMDSVICGKSVKIYALSPISEVFSRFVAHLAQYLPKKGEPISDAPEISLNFESVALHIEIGEDSIILGSDLENHNRLGWTALANKSWPRELSKASVYKIAHHGSKSGDCPDIWSTLLRKKPVACVTPWVRGGKRLPTDLDKKRIRGNTPHAYIASGATRKPRLGSDQIKRLNDIADNVLSVDSGFGAVRIRKELGTANWGTELFGAAQSL